MRNLILRFTAFAALSLLVVAPLIPHEAFAQGGVNVQTATSANNNPVFNGQNVIPQWQGNQNTNSNSTNPTTNNNSTCTSFAETATQVFDNPSGSSSNGMLSDIYHFIVDSVNDASKKLFSAFTSSNSYKNALGGATTLMVVFYAVAFVMGIVQPNFQQVLVRLVKIGLLMTLISPAGWDFFNENVVRFFQDGSDDIIRGVQQIGMCANYYNGGGNCPGIPANATPFYSLDRLASFIIQPDTIVALLGATFSGGPYGLMMGALMLIAVYGFFMLVLKALQVYAISFVARAMLLGLAPIFFVFLLFEKTKQMFMGWLNAIVNLSLRPILLFTFLSFFMVLMESASRDMLGTELCWQEFKNVEGSINKMAMWRFVDPNTKAPATEMTWQGSLECLLDNTGNQKCKEFPVNIVDILSFLILVYLAQRFTEVVDRISSELSNAFVSLDTQGKFEQMMQSKGKNGFDGASFINPKSGGQSGTGKKG